MEKETDFIIRKLQHYIDNYSNLTDDELKQSHYLVLHKANEHMNKYVELIKEVQNQNEELLEDNNQLGDMVRLYRSFIKDSGLTKRFELYSKGKDVI